MLGTPDQCLRTRARLLLVGLWACAAVAAAGAEGPAPWSRERAWVWYAQREPIRGFNYLPRSAVNTTAMWQAETFDAETVDQELGWAQAAGYNSARVFLQYIVWQADPDGLKQRVGRFLEIADRRGIGVMLVLFCDCSFAGREPYPGPQDAPVPGVHNSGWVPSPGLERVTDRGAWPDLERYVKDIVGAFGQDRRILVWDLYNEPGNSGMGDKSLPLAEAAFGWARSVGPSQPITTGAWADFEAPMSQRLLELSDIVSFHAYDDVAGVRRKIEQCRRYGRPIVCTEWLRRQVGNTFETILPVFAEHAVGWYHWGLVAGKTQTYMPWGSQPGDPVPAVWQHDVFHADGRAFDPAELNRVRQFGFEPEAMAGQLPSPCLVFSYFVGNGEDGLHLAISFDGLHFVALNEGQSFLTPTAGRDRLMRDPCITRGPDGRFHMVWTVSWGERGIGYAHSADLLTWSPQRYLPVMEHEPTARNCWAPEVYYDEATECFVLFWATTIPGRFPQTEASGDNGWNHRIYAATTRDFEQFTPTRLFYEPGFNVIDSTLVKHEGRYIMVLKDETRHPPQKNLRVAMADHVLGPYGPASEPITGPHWAEGPSAVRLGSTWHVYFDKYRQHRYGLVTSEDLREWEDRSAMLVMPEGARHGTVLTVPPKVLAGLLSYRRP